MDLLGRATRAGAFRETEILTAQTGMRKMIFRGLDEYFAYVPKTENGESREDLRVRPFRKVSPIFWISLAPRKTVSREIGVSNKTSLNWSSLKINR